MSVEHGQYAIITVGCHALTLIPCMQMAFIDPTALHRDKAVGMLWHYRQHLLLQMPGPDSSLKLYN